MRHGRRTLLPAIVVVLLATIGLAPAVSAHESTPAGVQRTELSLGDHRIVLTVTAPPPGGGRADVAVTPRGPDAAGAVAVAVARAGAPAEPAVLLPVDAVGRTSRATLAMPDPGAWEVVVADGTGVTDTARVPVAVAAPTPTPAGVWVFWAALLIGVAALVVAVGPGTRRRPRVALTVGALAVAGLTLAVTLAVVGVGGTAATPTAAAPAGGHDHGAMAGTMPGAMPMPADAPMSSTMAMPAEPGAVAATVRPSGSPRAPGLPTDLVLDLTDASSGAVVDDLAVHDDALVHLAVIGPTGQLAHVHPVRVAPGRYAVRLTPEAAGRHGVFAEMQRAGDGGHRIARTAFDVAGPAAPATDPTTAPAAAPAPGPGPREVDGLRVDVAVSSTAAGRPSRITATVSEAGRPVTDLQAWLGMAGHLMMLGPGVAGAPDPGDPASTFGHVHDMSAPGPGGTYGPQVGFDHTFPRAGRYALWVQVQHDWRTVTVPVTVDIGPYSAT